MAQVTIDHRLQELVVMFASSPGTKGTDALTIATRVIRMAAEEGILGVTMDRVDLATSKLLSAGKIERTTNDSEPPAFRQTEPGRKDVSIMGTTSKKNASRTATDSARPSARLADPRLPKAPATITRTYKDKDHVVEVTAEGLKYGGKSYGSLSAIAKVITGREAINGFLWFGLAGMPSTTEVTGPVKRTAAKKVPAKKPTPRKAKGRGKKRGK